MVPRYMTPPWLQDIGWHAPNAWTIEVHHGVPWRGEDLMYLLPEPGWLLAVAIVGTALALLVSRSRLWSWGYPAWRHQRSIDGSAVLLQRSGWCLRAWL